MPYDTAVAGVVSEQPGITLGIAGPDKLQIATTGRVKVRVDATNGSIDVGDLLVTSDVAGTAMRSVPTVFNGRYFHQPGTLIGKALEPLEKGVGEILVVFRYSRHSPSSERTIMNTGLLRLWAYAAIAVICTTGIASAADGGQKILISFSSEQVRATGITPGGDAVVFGCLIGRYSGLPLIQRHAEIVRDDDKNGEIVLNVERLPATSVWVIVDFSSGRYQVAAPENPVPRSASPKEMSLDEEKWKEGVEPPFLRRDYLEWLVVRPGAGAWAMSIAEGGSRDGDGLHNARLKLDLGALESLTVDGKKKAKPVSVKAKDVLVLIDPYTLDFVVRGAK